MLKSELVDAYLWHRAGLLSTAMKMRPALPDAEGFRASGNAAIQAVTAARRDVEAGRRRYPATPCAAVTWQSALQAHDTIGTWSNPFPPKPSRIAYVQSIAGAGLREVGRVVPETSRGEIWDRRGDTGWFTDPHGDVFKDGSGLCWGVVYQLPGRDGKSRFVAGYIMGGCSDDLPTVDFGTIFEEAAGDSWNVDPKDMDAARDAARTADAMAKHAAEEEREYQSAYAAGARWSDLGQEIAAERTAALELLAERRAARAAGITGDGYRAICATLRRSIESALRTIEDARERRRKLADGEQDGTWAPGFYTGDKRLREAFNEGAGETVLPA